MKSEDKKNRLIAATKELLLTAQVPEEITVRQIAEKAQVNLAMINYYFHSKEELLKAATDDIVASEFQKLTINEEHNLCAKERLKNLLHHLCEVTLSLDSITKLSVPYIVFEAPIELPFMILPYVKEHFGDRKSDCFCKMISYEIVTFLQIILYRKADFYQYSGISLQTQKELYDFIDDQVDLFLGGQDEK